MAAEIGGTAMIPEESFGSFGRRKSTETKAGP